MKTALSAGAKLLILLFILSGCGSPFGGDTLPAMRIEGEPTKANWERAVPLDLEVWLGNVNLRPEIVALDQETSHRSTAQCHHGPANSDPVKVRLKAFHNDRELYLKIRWPDATEDRDLGHWERGTDSWVALPGEDDGLAVLWGSAGAGSGTRQEFRCQRACHMIEVDVYDGGTQMRMGMKHEGGILDLWRWRAGVTAPFDRADDMVVDLEGKRGDEGQAILTTVPDPMGSGPVPYREIEKPSGRQGHVRTVSRWADGWWEVLFVRDLDTSDPDDTVFVRGLAVPFSISVFDNTFTEHHVLDTSADLVLVDRPSRGAGGTTADGRDPYDPLDF
ncbi:MAG: ethylbenzene dehydrogenase-related protein [bacterium]|nr:ethylbenzene dehydrogenase-related protein [bacterium]